MPIEINELIEQARADAALAYANIEIDRHNYRVKISEASEVARYFFSTPTKLHMSSLLYIAWSEDAWVRKADAAERLSISRQAASAILDQVHRAGWVDKRNDGYRYNDENAAYYTRAVSQMLIDLSSNLTESVTKLVALQDILSTHLSLTSDDRSSDTDVREVKHG